MSAAVTGRSVSAPADALDVFLVAGEASGDAHAAALVDALHAAAPEKEIEFYGSTGAKMRAAGVISVVDADALAILGLWEIARALPMFWRAYQHLKKAVGMRRPDAAILVDWPDFNFRLARWLHREGIPVIYYISPQLWAWRSHRARGERRDPFPQVDAHHHRQPPGDDRLGRARDRPAGREGDAGLAPHAHRYNRFMTSSWMI